MRKPALLAAAVRSIAFLTVTRAEQILKVEQVMTPQEMRETGIAKLSPAQTQAFDAWLNRYTLRMIAHRRQFLRDVQKALAA